MRGGRAAVDQWDEGCDGDELAQHVLFRLGTVAEHVWLDAGEPNTSLAAETKTRARTIAFVGEQCAQRNEDGWKID